MAQNVIINGVTYASVPSVSIPKAGGGTAQFHDVSAADASAADILSGKKAYGASGEINGAMQNNGAVSGTISTKAGTYAVPEGYHNGSGTVGIAPAEQAKIIAANIKSGVTILGQAGSSMVLDTTESSSPADASKILNGYSAFVNGSKVTGNASVPTVSQDSVTKILSIA